MLYIVIIVILAIIASLSIFRIVQLSRAHDIAKRNTTLIAQHLVANRNLIKPAVVKPTPPQNIAPPTYSIAPPTYNIAPPQLPLRFVTSVKVPATREWRRIGVCFSVSTTEDSVFNVEERLIYTDSYEYRIVDSEKSIMITVLTGQRDALKTGATFTIPGKDSLGPFELVRDSDYSYIPL